MYVNFFGTRLPQNDSTIIKVVSNERMGFLSIILINIVIKKFIIKVARSLKLQFCPFLSLFCDILTFFMVVECSKMITLINTIEGHHKISFEIICLDLIPFVVFSKENQSSKQSIIKVEISKNCNWKDLAAFLIDLCEFFDVSH